MTLVVNQVGTFQIDKNNYMERPIRFKIIPDEPNPSKSYCSLEGYNANPTVKQGTKFNYKCYLIDAYGNGVTLETFTPNSQYDFTCQVDKTWPNSAKINPKIMEHKFKPNQLHSNSNLKKTRKNFRNTKESIYSNKSNNHKSNMISRRNSKSLGDLRQVYYYEIKSAYKVTDEMVQSNMTSLEKFEKELSNKIRNFQVVKENLESSQKLIDKLKLHLLIV